MALRNRTVMPRMHCIEINHEEEKTEKENACKIWSENRNWTQLSIAKITPRKLGVVKLGQEHCRQNARSRHHSYRLAGKLL